MSNFIKFKTVTKSLDFVSIDSVFLVTNNFIYYTYGDKIESVIINEDSYVDIVNQISYVNDGWIDIRDHVEDKNEMSHLFVRKNSIKGFVKNYDKYELKLEHNLLSAEIEAPALIEYDVECLIYYLSE